MKKIFCFVFVLMNYCVGSDSFFTDFKDVLRAVRQKVASPRTCFISRSTNDPAKDAQDFVIGSLISSGISVIADEPMVEFLNDTLSVKSFLPFGENTQSFMNKINTSKFVIVLNTRKYFERSESRDPDAGVPQELERICRRMAQDPKDSFLISLLLEGTKASSVPIRLSTYLFNPCVNGNDEFDKRICCLQILLLLQQKFYRKNSSIKEIINRFLDKFFEIEKQVKDQEEKFPFLSQPARDFLFMRVLFEQVVAVSNLSLIIDVLYLDSTVKGRDKRGIELVHIVRTLFPELVSSENGMGDDKVKKMKRISQVLSDIKNAKNVGSKQRKEDIDEIINRFHKLDSNGIKSLVFEEKISMYAGIFRTKKEISETVKARMGETYPYLDRYDRNEQLQAVLKERRNISTKKALAQKNDVECSCCCIM